MKTALFVLGALIFVAFVQAEDSRITNFKNRSKREDWLIQFEVKEGDYNYCIQFVHDACFLPGIYTPEITFLNQIVFRGIASNPIRDQSEVGLMLQAIGNYSPTIFLPEIPSFQSFFTNLDGTPYHISDVAIVVNSITDVTSGNYAIQLGSCSNGYALNIFWLYLPDLNSPNQGTNNDNDDSESWSCMLTAVISLLILAILL